MSGVNGRQATLPLGAVRTDDGAVVVPESRRADGSVRKTIRIRQGYVPQEEVPKYKPVGERMRELQAKQSKADEENLASGLQTLSLESTKEKETEKPLHAGSRESDQRRPQSPPAARAASSVSSAGALSNARDLKAELTNVNKSLREITKLEEFAAAAARGDDGARPLTVAQHQKMQRKPQLEKRRQELVVLLDDGRTASSTNATSSKPTTLRVVEL